MQDKTSKLTHGAMMVAIFIILLAISVYVPLLGTVTMFFIPLPIILYRLRYDRTSSIFMLIVGMVLSLIGGILLLPVAFIFGPLGFVIGEAIQNHKTKLYTFMAAGLTFLITTILLYLASVLLFGLNLMEEISEGMLETREQAIAIFEKAGELPENFTEQLNDTFLLAVKLIPSVFMITSFVIGFVIILVNLPIVNRLGHETAKFPPFRLMKLPLLTIWVYMIFILLPYITSIEPGSTIELSYVNGSFILRFLFLLQGISFIHHVMYEMKSQKWLTILLTIVAILFNPLTVIIGILDTGINLRAWVGKNKSR